MQRSQETKERKKRKENNQESLGMGQLRTKMDTGIGQGSQEPLCLVWRHDAEDPVRSRDNPWDPGYAASIPRRKGLKSSIYASSGKA